MVKSNESVWDASVLQEASLLQVRPEAAIVKMSESIAIVGIHQPEKLAEGQCPRCQTMVDLWATNQGFELSLHGKGYRLAPDIEAPNRETPATSNKDEPPSRTPLIVETPKTKKYPMPSLMHFLLTPIPCSLNIKRAVFFVLLSLASFALLIQTIYLFWPPTIEPRVILLDTGWAGAIKTLGLFACALLLINVIAYKVRFSDSGPNQIDRWILASSIVILSYYILSHFVLPLLLIL
jgi:hypothetical protein